MQSFSKMLQGHDHGPRRHPHDWSFYIPHIAVWTSRTALHCSYCDSVTEAKGGSQFFHRVGDARVPELLEFELLQTAATCNKHTSVEADLRRLERGANFQECSRACAEQESCLVFQFSRTGFCKMWRECNDITSKPNVLIYGRTEAATSITATVTTATGITQTSVTATSITQTDTTATALTLTSQTATSITQADDTAAETGALQGRSRDAEHTDAVVSGNMTSSSVGTWIVLAAALVGAGACSCRVVPIPRLAHGRPVRILVCTGFASTLRLTCTAFRLAHHTHTPHTHTIPLPHPVL